MYNYYAYVNEQYNVTQVIYTSSEIIESGSLGPAENWYLTSENMLSGVNLKGLTPFRANFAKIGYVYDIGFDMFLPPKPFPSWVVNLDTSNWSAPIHYPSDGKHYIWDENTTNWIEVESPII